MNVSTVCESILSKDDIPWEVLKRRGHESVRLLELTRFYLELQKDPHGPEVALFVHSLDANLSQKQYEKILLDELDECECSFTHGQISTYTYVRVFHPFISSACKFVSIGPIYYEYGSMVITFDNSESAVAAYEMLKESKYQNEGGKSILGKHTQSEVERALFYSVRILCFYSSNVADRESVHGGPRRASAAGLREREERRRPGAAAQAELQQAAQPKPGVRSVQRRTSLRVCR